MTKISLRYARALHLATDKKASELEETAENLDTAAEILSDKKIVDFFRDPQISKQNKEALIEKAFLKIPLLANFLKLVVRNNKISEIKNIAAGFRSVLSEAAGVATAKVESAKPLTEEQVADLITALKKFTGKEISIEITENSKLLGGVRIYLDDELIDLSLIGKLKKLGKTFG